MKEQSQNNSDLSVTIETLLGVPFNFIVGDWKSIEPVSRIDPSLLLRAQTILDAVASLIGHSKLDRLRSDIDDGNEHALGALVQLNKNLGMACDVLIERCKRWKSDEKWTDLRHEAELAARITAAAGRDSQQALALFLLANAYRALGDTQGTIEAYKATIKAAKAARDEHLLAVANDNLGNVLADIGSFDEALSHYAEALRRTKESDSSGIRAIRTNRANALKEIGELRSSAQELRKIVEELEHAGMSGRQLAVALDNAAMPVARLGEQTVALEMLEHARTLFQPDDLPGRAINSLSRSTVNGTMGNKSAAAEAFIEAHDLAFEDARRRIDPEHYRRGFLASLAVRLPADDEANRLFVEGIAAKEGGALQQALDRWQLARKRSWDVGDYALALRIDANVAALLYENAGQVNQAVNIAMRVRHQASELGLARPELMAIGTLGSLAATGADVRDPLGHLGAFVTSAVLLEVHKRIVAAANIDAKEAILETYDPGTVANELAIQAETHHADLLAVRYYREAVDKARAIQGWFQLANRLAGLRSVLSRNEYIQDADIVAEELTRLLEKDLLPDRGKLVAHRGLAFHLARRDRTAAINHIREACVLGETLRQSVRPGTERADVARQWPHLYHKFAQLLRENGDDTAAFEALQGEKARRLIDALSALDTGKARVSDAPPRIGEIMTLIDRLISEHPTFLIDFAVEEDGLTVYIVGHGTVRAIHVGGSLTELAAVEGGDVLEREARLVELCQRDPLLSNLAAAVTDAVPKGCRLLLVPDQFLHNLPLHVIPVQGQPWCDHFSIGYLAAAAALRFAPGKRPAAGRSLVAGDSRGDLPHASEECKQVATALGSKPLVGPNCTRAAIEEVLRAGELDVIHLALHGRGDVRRGGRASLLLADGMGGTEWVAFDELASLPWRAELVVFSGCSTAVAGPRQGHELVGIARAAAERGAAAVIACLWPVGDEAARIFMTAFYKKFAARRTTGPVDLRLVLDEARRSLRTKFGTVSAVSGTRRDGRSLRPEVAGKIESPKLHPEIAEVLSWAPFIVFGDPILGG